MPGPRVTVRRGRSRGTIVFSSYASVPGPTRVTTVGAVSPTIVRSVGLASPDARDREDGGTVGGSREQKAHSDRRSGRARRQVGHRGRERWPRAIQPRATAAMRPTASPAHHNPRRDPAAETAAGRTVRGAAGRDATSRGGTEEARLDAFSPAASGAAGPAAIREARTDAVPVPGG